MQPSRRCASSSLPSPRSRSWRWPRVARRHLRRRTSRTTILPEAARPARQRAAKPARASRREVRDSATVGAPRLATRRPHARTERCATSPRIIARLRARRTPTASRPSRGRGAQPTRDIARTANSWLSSGKFAFRQRSAAVTVDIKAAPSASSPSRALRRRTRSAGRATAHRPSSVARSRVAAPARDRRRWARSNEGRPPLPVSLSESRFVHASIVLFRARREVRRPSSRGAFRCARRRGQRGVKECPSPKSEHCTGRVRADAGNVDA